MTASRKAPFGRPWRASSEVSSAEQATAPLSWVTLTEKERRLRFAIARPDLFHRPAVPLRPSAACRHNQRLPQRMRMPRRAGARLERDTRARHPCRSGGLKQRINPHRASEPIGRTFVGSL